MEIQALKIGIIVICATLKFLGEVFSHNFQRFVMPVVLGVGVSFSSHTWWLGLTTLPVIGILCLGYGDKSPLKRGLGDASARGMWLFLCALVIGLGPVFTHHLSWFFCVPYFLICGIWGATTRNLPNFIIAPITGALLASVLFFVHP